MDEEVFNWRYATKIILNKFMISLNVFSEDKTIAWSGVFNQL